MKATVTRERIAALIAIVEFELARIDECCGERPKYGEEGYSFEASDAWWRKRDQEIENSKRRLAAEGAKFSFRPAHDHAISLGGFRSSSTSGFAGAFRNWVTAARRRLETEDAR